MKLTDNFINNNTRIWLTILLLGIGGIIAYLNIGRLETRLLPSKPRSLSPAMMAHRHNRLKKKSRYRWRMPFRNSPMWMT